MLNIRTVTEVLKDQKPAYLVIGGSGKGKTTFAGTFPGKKCWIELGEDGLSSVRGEDVVSPEIKTFQDFQSFLENIGEYHKKLKFDTLVIDTINGMQQMFFRDIIAKDKNPNFEDWNKWTSQLVTTLNFLKTCAKQGKFELVWIGHEKNFGEVNSDGERMSNHFKVDVNSANTTKVHAMAEIVMRMVTRDVPLTNEEGKLIMDKNTGKGKIGKEYIGILSKSQDSEVKLRTTLKSLKETKEEFYLTNPTFDHFQAIRKLETQEAKTGKAYPIESIEKLALKIRTQRLKKEGK